MGTGAGDGIEGEEGGTKDLASSSSSSSSISTSISASISSNNSRSGARMEWPGVVVSTAMETRMARARA